jgi:fructose-1,6-bisphosphatase
MKDGSTGEKYMIVKGSVRDFAQGLADFIATWTPEEKASARAHLDRWHAATIWDREYPTRPYAKEFRN